MLLNVKIQICQIERKPSPTPLANGRSSEPEPACSAWDKSTIVAGWLRSLTSALLRLMDSPLAPRGLGRGSLAVLAVLRPLKRGRRIRRWAPLVALKPV